jgi:hypothetical protein
MGQPLRGPLSFGHWSKHGFLNPYLLLGPSLERLPLFFIVGPSFSFQLDAVSVDDRRNQPGKTPFDLGAAGGVVHFNASTFAPNQARLSQDFEVLRES